MVGATLERFDFSKEVEEKLFSLFLRDKEAMLIAYEYIKQEYFEDDIIRFLWKYLRQYYEKYEEIPSIGIFLDYIGMNITPMELKVLDKSLVEERLYQISKGGDNLEYLKDKILNFAKTKARLNAISESFPLIQAGKYNEVNEIWERASLVGERDFDIGVKYFEDIFVRGRAEELEKIPTLIEGLDRSDVLDGGLCRGELGVVLAPPKGGKTTALIAIARGAVWTSYRVVYYSLEMSEDRMLRRFDTAFKVREENRVEDLRWIKAFGGDLVIKKFPTKGVTVKGIKNHLSYLEKKFNWVPDLVVVDYGEILAASRGRADDWIEMGEKYEELRNLAETKNCVVWTAVQANRGAFNKAIIDGSDIGRSIEPLKILDFCVAICQTKEDRDDNRARLYIAYNRNNKAGQEIPCSLNFDTMELK